MGLDGLDQAQGCLQLDEAVLGIEVFRCLCQVKAPRRGNGPDQLAVRARTTITLSCSADTIDA
jgi:hypothetical protein